MEISSGRVQTNLLCTSKHHQTEAKTSSDEEQTKLLCTLLPQNIIRCNPNLSSDKMNSRSAHLSSKAPPTKLKSRLVSINSLPHREGWGGPLTPLALWGGVGGEAYTLVAPVTPFQRGCQPFVQRRCGTRAPLIAKFRAHARDLPLYPFFTTIKESKSPKVFPAKNIFRPKVFSTKNTVRIILLPTRIKAATPSTGLQPFYRLSRGPSAGPHRRLILFVFPKIRGSGSNVFFFEFTLLLSGLVANRRVADVQFKPSHGFHACTNIHDTGLRHHIYSFHILILYYFTTNFLPFFTYIP